MALGRPDRGGGGHSDGRHGGRAGIPGERGEGLPHPARDHGRAGAAHRGDLDRSDGSRGRADPGRGPGPRRASLRGVRDEPCPGGDRCLRRRRDRKARAGPEEQDDRSLLRRSLLRHEHASRVGPPGGGLHQRGPVPARDPGLARARTSRAGGGRRGLEDARHRSDDRPDRCARARRVREGDSSRSAQRALRRGRQGERRRPPARGSQRARLRGGERRS